MTLNHLRLEAQRNYKIIVLTGVVMVGIVAGLAVLKQNLDLKQKASLSTGTAVVTLSPATSNLTPCQTATIDTTAEPISQT